MKKLTKLTKIMTVGLAIMMSAACAFGCSDDEDEAEKTPAAIETTEYAYTSGGDGIVVGVRFNDAAFEKLMLSGAEVSEEYYRVTASTIMFTKGYLNTLGAGEYTFTIVTDLGEASFKLTVIVPEKEVGIADLIDNSYYHVDLGEGKGVVAFPSAEELDGDSDLNKYLRLKNGNKPLEVGESFTCRYGVDDFWTLRLRPYNVDNLPSSFGDDAGTAFSYITDANGTGLCVKSNGDNYPTYNDALKLKGSSFVNGAKYTLSVTYCADGLAGATAYISFQESGTLINMNGAGMQTKEKTFTVSDTLYLTGDHGWYYDCLRLTISSRTPASVVIYSLTLTRVA